MEISLKLEIKAIAYLVVVAGHYILAQNTELNPTVSDPFFRQVGGTHHVPNRLIGTTITVQEAMSTLL